MGASRNGIRVGRPYSATNSERPYSARSGRSGRSGLSSKRKNNPNKALIMALHSHFRSIGKSNSQGFQYMDKNSNGIIDASEIVTTFKEAGKIVSVARAEELIRGYVTEDGVMDMSGYIRFMASAYTYDDA